MIEWIVSDLSDADLLLRPVPQANHLAWQLGHLIVAERHLVLLQIPAGAMPDLPEGFEQKHGKETATLDDASAFCSRDEYVTLLGKVREATLAELSKLKDSDLDRPTVGSLSEHCPTLGTLFGMLSDHIMMHLGQASVVRRKLGKPVLF